MPRGQASNSSSSSSRGRGRSRGWRGRGRGRGRGDEGTNVRSSPYPRVNSIASSSRTTTTRRPSTREPPPFSQRGSDSTFSGIPQGFQATTPTGGDAQDADSDESIQHEVIMAIDLKENSSIGCAYLSTTDGVLYISDDIPMPTLDITDQFISHIQPTTLLVSARASEQFHEYIEKHSAVKGESDASEGIILRGLQSSEFAFESARDRLIDLQLEKLSATGILFSAGLDNDPLDYMESHAIKSLRYGGAVNLSSRNSVGCAGAVLGDLHRRRSAGFLPDGQVAGALFRVHDIQMFSLSAFMFIGSDALLSLQILQTECHPNSQAWGPNPAKGNSKESLSIYGLFHHMTCTPQGRARLRQLFLQPVLDIALIEERQKTISVLLQPDNAEKVAQLVSTLRKIRNLRTVFTQLRKGNESPSAVRSFDKGIWATILSFTSHALALREVVKSINGGACLQINAKLIDSLRQNSLVEVGDTINKTIDFEQSKTRHRTSVKAGIDPHLDELKRRYDGMDSFLTEVINHMSRELPEWARKYIRSCIFLPQIGFLTVVEPNPVTGNGQYEGEGMVGDAWEKLFAADGAVCYKNSYMRELDEEYGDMYCQIGDREVEIIHGLASSVLAHEQTMVEASDMCGEFDSILALALGAKKYNWKPPRMVEGSVIEVEGGWHPLQQLVVPSFVPNDCYVAAGSVSFKDSPERPTQVLVLTGPNHSGKSVYLKQVAIIVFLAHIGSFVPAASATVGLTDRIMTCISPRESMSGSESTFAADMKQATLSMKSTTSRSLVLVDEFGKGTNGDDGSGLLAALLDYFLSLADNGPRVLVASHYHEIFEGGYLAHHPGLYLAHMDVRVDWDLPRSEDQVTYLFKLAEGHSTSSFGSRCAALNGVPSLVVERAEAITLLVAQNEDLRAVCSRLSAEEEQQLEEAEKTARLFLSQEFDEAIRAGGSGESGMNGGSIKEMLDGLLSNT